MVMIQHNYHEGQLQLIDKTTKQSNQHPLATAEARTHTHTHKAVHITVNYTT